jgi:hypothetical protein
MVSEIELFYCTFPKLLIRKRYYIHYILCVVRFEVFTAVTMKNVVFWDVAPLCRSWVNRRFGGTSQQVMEASHLLHQEIS